MTTRTDRNQTVLYAKKLLVTLVIVACLLPTAALGGDTVLCFGRDGHVALEIAQDGVCQSDQCAGKEAGAEQKNAITGTPAPAPVQWCTDVPVSAQPAATQTSDFPTRPGKPVGVSIDRAITSPAALFQGDGHAGHRIPILADSEPTPLSTRQSILRI